MNPPRRKIYHQGHLDGACFLYTVANAYKALTGNKVTRQKWDRAMASVPDPLRFLTGVGATQMSYEAAVSLIEVLLDAFRESGERFTIDQLDPTLNVAELGAEITPNSVVMFSFRVRTEVHEPSGHIVAAVAASTDPARLHLACSAAFSGRHLQDGTYAERFHPDVGRYSNDTITDAGVEIGENWRWRLTFVRDA